MILYCHSDNHYHKKLLLFRLCTKTKTISHLRMWTILVNISHYRFFFCKHSFNKILSKTKAAFRVFRFLCLCCSKEHFTPPPNHRTMTTIILSLVQFTCILCKVSYIYCPINKWYKATESSCSCMGAANFEHIVGFR